MQNILSKKAYFESDQFISDSIGWLMDCVCDDSELEKFEEIAGNVDPFTCLKRILNEKFDGGTDVFYETYVDFNK